MSVEVKIFGESAKDALAELQVFSTGLTARAPAYTGPLTSDEAKPNAALAAVVPIVEQPGAEAPAPAAEPEQPKKRTRRTKAEMEAERAAVASTEPPEESPEDDAQDAEDEAAEDAASVKELTHDDVRNALGAYVKKFGMDAAQADGPRCIALILTGDMGATKNGAAYKVSDVPGDQESLRKAVDGVNEMTEKNPFKRSEVA